MAWTRAVLAGALASLALTAPEAAAPDAARIGDRILDPAARGMVSLETPRTSRACSRTGCSPTRAGSTRASTAPTARGTCRSRRLPWRLECLREPDRFVSDRVRFLDSCD